MTNIFALAKILLFSFVSIVVKKSLLILFLGGGKPTGIQKARTPIKFLA